MFRRAGHIGFVLALAGCTEQVVLRDLPATSDAAVPADVPPDDAGTGSGSSCASGYKPLSFWPQPAQVMILFDRSSAMQSSFGGSTRALAAQTALASAVSTYEARIKFGFEQFPTDPTEYPCPQGSCCAEAVSIDPKSYQASYVNKSIQCGDSRGFGCPYTVADSPSHKALAMIREFYKAKPTIDDVYVLLVTSSDPSCAAEGNDVCSSARNAASELGEDKVRVIVLNLGNPPDKNSCLSQISQKGFLKLPAGIQTLYAATNTYELSIALKDLFWAIARTSCTFINSNNKQPDEAGLYVSIGEEGIPETDGNNENGWSYTNAERTSIKFFGSACDKWVNSQEIKPAVGYCTAWH